MEGIGGSNFVEVAVPVKIHVLGLGDGRLQPVLAAKAMQTSPRFDLVLMDNVDLFSGEKDGLLFQVADRR